MYHYDDRYYWSPECAECGIELTERTVAELEKAMAEHNCSQPGQGATRPIGGPLVENLQKRHEKFV